MNLFEAGVISGAPTGAAIGGIVCRSYGIPGIIGGSLAGLVSGAVAGWLYAFVAILLLAVIGVIWRGVRKRPEPSEADMRMMSHTVQHGLFAGTVVSFVLWVSFGWLPALMAALAIVSVYSFLAVARCGYDKVG